MDSSPNQTPAVDPASKQAGGTADPPGVPTVIEDVQPPKAVSVDPDSQTPSAPSMPSAALGGTAQVNPISATGQTEEAPIAPPDESSKPKQAKLISAHAHSNKPIGAIIAAILIASLLAGLTIFAYIKTKDSDSKSANTPPPTSAATAEDVDKTSQDLDNSLSGANNTEGFSTNDLTDSSLGL